MIKPDYKEGSIVNLMSSIAQAFNGRTPYKNLKVLSPQELKKSKNIVLFVIDGMGYNYLINQKNSFLKLLFLFFFFLLLLFFTPQRRFLSKLCLESNLK